LFKHRESGPPGPERETATQRSSNHWDFMARRPFLNFLPQAPEGARSSSGAIRPPRRISLLRNFEESGRGWFWATDADGRLTYISDSRLQLCSALAQDALIGTAVVDLFVTADDRDVRDRLPFVLGRQDCVRQVRAEERPQRGPALVGGVGPPLLQWLRTNFRAIAATAST
jgi:hypothetical protein